MMENALFILQILAAIGSLVCCVLVWIKMFHYGETTRAIIYIATTFVFGIGALLTLLWGVRKHTEWSLQTVMNSWAVCIIVNLLAVVANLALQK
jgi:hypothetical protein